MARSESNLVMVLRGRSARKARSALTLCVLLPAQQQSNKNCCLLQACNIECHSAQQTVG